MATITLKNVPDDLYRRLVEDKESFWSVVYPLYMQREITKQNVRDLVRKGLDSIKQIDFAPKQTIRSIKEDVEWAKHQTS